MDLSEIPLVGRVLGGQGPNPSDDGSRDEIRPYRVLSEETTPIRTDDVDTLRAATKEARVSLDTIVEAIEQKDDKAISTVRLNLLVLGLAITIASTVPASIWYANWFTIIGFVLLVCSTFFGIWAYTYTNYPPGITPDYLEEINSAKYSEREWLQWMTERYEHWIRVSARSDSIEARHLGRTHLLQIGAVALLVAGGIAGFYGMPPADIVPVDSRLQNPTNERTTATNNTSEVVVEDSLESVEATHLCVSAYRIVGQMNWPVSL